MVGKEWYIIKKKGFTLVELLAVISILAVLVIIALPNIVGLFNQAKANAFEVELKNLYKAAEQKWMTDSMIETDQKIYTSQSGGTSLNLSGRGEIKYCIIMNKAGKVTTFKATDGTYQYKYTGGSLDLDAINTAVKDGGPYNCKTNTCNYTGCSCSTTASGTFQSMYECPSGWYYRDSYACSDGTAVCYKNPVGGGQIQRVTCSSSPKSVRCTSATCSKSGCSCTQTASGTYYNYESNAPENMVVQVSKITVTANRLAANFACN